MFPPDTSSVFFLFLHVLQYNRAHSQGFFICLLKFSFHNIAKPVLQKSVEIPVAITRQSEKGSLLFPSAGVTSLGCLGTLVLLKQGNLMPLIFYK